MHQKPTEYGRSCMQNNQFPINSHVDLEDNSIRQLEFNLETMQKVLTDWVCAECAGHLCQVMRRA